jgi:nucleotide-binding universal stress UspA family protein
MAFDRSTRSVRSRSASGSDVAAPHTAPSVFESILCGVDGSTGAAGAARQAAILAGTGASLRLLGVARDTGTRRPAGASAFHRLAAALETARLEARSLGVSPTVDNVDGREETAILLAEAAHHDLLVLGACSSRRTSGVPAGSTARAAVRCRCSWRGRRRPPWSSQAILAAIDGTPATAGVAETVASLARAHGARVTVVAPAALMSPAHERVVDGIAAIAEATGADPLVLDEHGAAHKVVVAAAANHDAALVIIGMMSSVAERVALEAPCSVLVVRRGRTVRLAIVSRFQPVGGMSTRRVDRLTVKARVKRKGGRAAMEIATTIRRAVIPRADVPTRSAAVAHGHRAP